MTLVISKILRLWWQVTYRVDFSVYESPMMCYRWDQLIEVYRRAQYWPHYLSLFTPSCLGQNSQLVRCIRDDLQIYYSFLPDTGEATVLKFTEDLNRLFLKCCQLSLVLNPSKSILLISGNTNYVSNINTKLNITIVGQKIPILPEAKTLGLNIDNFFTYE